MKASIDREACIGCGLCAGDCPEVFAMDDQSIATVIVDPVPGNLADSAKSATANCPVEAIKITE